MLPFVAVIPELSGLLASLSAFLGYKLIEKNRKNDTPLFGDVGGVINSYDLPPVDDTHTTRPITEPVVPYDNVSDNVGGNVDNVDMSFVKFKLIDEMLSKEYSDSANSEIDVNSISKEVSIDDVLPDINSDTLIDVMKGNSQSLVAVLTLLVNTISAGMVSNAMVNAKVAKNMESLSNNVAELKTVLSLIGMNGVYISDYLSKLHLDNADVSAFMEHLKLNGFHIKNEVIENAMNTVASASDGISEVMQNINSSGLGIKNEVIENAMNTVASAKELEKENYEYMKTPQTYTLSDEDLPKLAPRDVIALSEAVKAHLNSQEASLTGEDLSEFESDFDLGDVLAQLFNFKGITQDINEINEKLNEDEGGENGS